MKQWVVAVAIMMASPAFADTSTIPTFDSAGYCTKLYALIAPNSELMKSTCISTQADALQKLKNVWASTPEDVRKACLSTTQLAPISASYQGLAGCLANSVGQLWLDQKVTIANPKR